MNVLLLIIPIFICIGIRHLLRPYYQRIHVLKAISNEDLPSLEYMLKEYQPIDPELLEKAVLVKDTRILKIVLAGSSGPKIFIDDRSRNIECRLFTKVLKSIPYHEGKLNHFELICDEGYGPALDDLDALDFSEEGGMILYEVEKYLADRDQHIVQAPHGDGVPCFISVLFALGYFPKWNGWLPQAIAGNRFNLVRFLLDHGVDPNNNHSSLFPEETPLLMAYKTKQIGIFRLLIEHGARMRKCDPMMRRWAKAVRTCSRAEIFLLAIADTRSILSSIPRDVVQAILSKLIEWATHQGEWLQLLSL